MYCEHHYNAYAWLARLSRLCFRSLLLRKHWSIITATGVCNGTKWAATKYATEKVGGYHSLVTKMLGRVELFFDFKGIPWEPILSVTYMKFKTISIPSILFLPTFTLRRGRGIQTMGWHPSNITFPRMCQVVRWSCKTLLKHWVLTKESR